MPVGRSSSPTHQQGARAEDAAAIFMLQQGYQLVAQNFNTRFGEIDLIVQRDNQLVFVEVRQRKIHAMVSAAESITVAKQRKIIKAAQCFLQQHKQYRNHDCRFDVMASTALFASNRPKKTAVLHADSTSLQPVPEPVIEFEWIQAAFYAA